MDLESVGQSGSDWTARCEMIGILIRGDVKVCVASPVDVAHVKRLSKHS